MTVEREINYEAMAQDAMRGIVRTVLTRVAKSGLPGEHHFYIAFKTDTPGVSISKRLKERYPEEMTVVLQHRFWDLIVSEDRFEVKLTFDNIPEKLVVPFSSIKVFFDPSVPYGLQFDEADGDGSAGHQIGSPRTDATSGEPSKSPVAAEAGRTEKKPRAPRRSSTDSRPHGEKNAERPVPSEKAAAKLPIAKPTEPAPGAGPKVVSIDSFRKK